jgi:ribosome maturation factor RimP
MPPARKKGKPDSEAGAAPEDRLTGPKKEALVLDRVNRFAAPLCEAEGMELVFAEYIRDRGGRVLRLYIDKPGGVSLDDCAWISRQVSDYLDVSLEGIGPYRLEVSSPGPERPIGKVSDYDRFTGRKAKITTAEPRRGRKNFTGFLAGVADDAVILKMDEKTVSIPLAEIRRARLVDGEN